MSHAVQPQPADTSPAYYRRDFRSFSLGTEEELVGAAAEVSAEQYRAIVTGAAVPDVRTPDKVFGLVGEVGSTEVLVEITRDLPDRAAPNTFKIELRTTPTERNDDAGWQRRTAALGVTVDALWTLRDGPLQDGEFDGFQLRVLDSDYILRLGAEVPDADIQATVGIPVEQICLNLSTADVGAGIMHPLLTVTWYESRFEDDPAVAHHGPTDRRRYAFVMSAILKCAKILKANRMNPETATAKNAWGVLPRKPLFPLLALLPSVEDAIAAANAIAGYAMPDWPNAQATVIDQDAWAAAKIRILGRDLLASMKTGITIGGSVGMTFEYRSPDRRDVRFAGRFWRRPTD
ncbi:hypothetical protein FRACA_80008 [Frankia canadensis]|uniref:Uncharacterized protein n=1 Tax=Frankia canadensis TaxID=1836972 RepID=A0A2I2L1C3_9ACTN|nr:hypothetical protein [Frankia canadensis]SNQ51708.1 hypothetical protein FRACA_80008 [Frankia canadensis]SOU58998.1 hypothetical protein FRACA_80008 [Frankia canadensis]